MGPAEPDDDAYDAIVATYRAIRRASMGLVADEALTRPQYDALSAIAKNGAMLMKKMSEALLVTPANVTGIVDRLEQKGLIRRTASQGDRRATIIELTPEGREVQERVAERRGELVRRALSALTPEEQETLRLLLEKLQREMTRSRDEA